MCFCASIVVIHWRIYSFRMTCDFPLFWNRCRRHTETIFQNATFQHTKLPSSKWLVGRCEAEKNKHTNVHSYSLNFIGSSDVYVEVSNSSPFICVRLNENDVYGVGIRTLLHLKYLYHSLCTSCRFDVQLDWKSKINFTLCIRQKISDRKSAAKRS